MDVAEIRENTMNTCADDQICLNSAVHDCIAPLYESRHGEIFNQVEQDRIRDVLAYAAGQILTGAPVRRVLDFGAGTGNLTRHLLPMNLEVVASDVSAGCLRELESSVAGSERLECIVLNGRDLSQFADASFDMVATYSVLHHVPDYLAVVDEFIRVVKPGGVIYIDHEVCPAYWEERPEYREYCRELAGRQLVEQESVWQYLSGIFQRKNWWRSLGPMLWLRFNRLADEGDIHVHPEDHIEWEQIRSQLDGSCELLLEKDYLVCREKTFPAPPVWSRWHTRCCDMRLMIARKKPVSA